MFIILCQHAGMYEHVMFKTLSGTMNAIFGGNVYNVMLHVNTATFRGLTSFIFVSYIMWFQKIIVSKIPPGGSIASSRLKVSEFDQEIFQSHRLLQTSPPHRQEVPQNIYSNNTSVRQ